MNQKDGGGHTDHSQLTTHNSSIVAAITATGRSVVYQLTTFYLRTPLKLFRPARFDYTHYLRILLTGEDDIKSKKERVNIQRPHSGMLNLKYIYYLKNSSLGVITTALNKYGWRVIPDRVLPPLLANSATGMILYTTYLTSLNYFNNTGNSQYNDPYKTFISGFLAGAAQAVSSAPIDAIYTRSSANELLSVGKIYNNLWIYGLHKLKEIGLIGCFGGFGLTFIKESFGFAIYFTTFEMIKGQVCCQVINFVKRYRELKYRLRRINIGNIFTDEDKSHFQLTEPCIFMNKKESKWFQRVFIFVGGVTAALFLQLIQFPFSKLQKVHLSRLEAFDIYSKATKHNEYLSKLSDSQSSIKIKIRKGNPRLCHIYYNSYVDTFEHIFHIHKNTRKTIVWLYKGFMRNTIVTIPGTTAGLLFLELMRNKLGESIENASQKPLDIQVS